MNLKGKHIWTILVVVALAVTPLLAGTAHAAAPKARAIQDGVSLDTETEGNLIDDIDCVGGIEVAEVADYTMCYLVPEGVPTPDYNTDPSVVSQEGSLLGACPSVGGFGATQECFATTFSIALFTPGDWRFVIEFYDAQDQIIDIQGVDFRNHTFFVVPESPIGILALVMSSLAVLGGFVFLRSRNRPRMPM